MKLLIIASPHEADRIRRAAVASGVETAAVEPGEGLSGWITATRPDLIILASRIVSADPNVALAKVRSVPRGRVPILLVGDADEEAGLRDLASGFFARPLVPDALLARARDVVARVALRSGDDPHPGPHGLGARGDEAGSGPNGSSHRSGPEPLTEGVAAPSAAAASSTAGVAAPSAAAFSTKGSGGVRSLSAAPNDGRADSPAGEASARPSALTPTRAPILKPLVAARAEPGLFAALADDIDADFDAEIRDVVRAVGALRQARSPSTSDTSVSSGRGFVRPGENDAAVERVIKNDAESALDALENEISQTTSEVPLTVSAALTETGRDPATEKDPAADHRVLVLARHALVESGDYFQILGVSRDAATPDIEEAYERAMSELSMGALHPAVTEDLRGKVNETRVVLTEAARLLRDDRLRGQYRQHLPPLVSSTRSRAPSPLPSPSPSKTSASTPARAQAATSAPTAKPTSADADVRES